MFDFDLTLPLMMAQFVALVYVMNIVFYKPLTKVITDREDYVRSNTTGAKEQLDQANKLAEQYEQELADTRRQSQSTIASAQEEAQQIAQQEIAEVQKQIQAELQQAQQELEQQKQSAFQTLEGQVNTLSNQILDKLLV